MKLSHWKSLSMFAAVVALLAASTNLATAAHHEEPNSGFLDADVAAKLKKTTLSDKRVVKRWMSSEMNRKNYHSVMVDRVIFYPSPHPGPQISSSTLDAIGNHLTYTLRAKIGDKVPVVDKAGPGVLRIQPALMTVDVEKEGMSAMDVIPIHLLFTAAKSASGGSAMDVSAIMEVRITDSVSGDNRAGVRMTLTGEKLKDSKAMLKLENLQKALDAAASDGANSVGDKIAH